MAPFFFHGRRRSNWGQRRLRRPLFALRSGARHVPGHGYEQRGIDRSGFASGRSLGIRTVSIGHRSVAVRPSADARSASRAAPSQLDRLQRRDFQLPGAASRAGRRGLAVPNRERHRSDPARLRAMGYRLPSKVSRHVCHGVVGRKTSPALVDSRPHGSQAPLLLHSPRTYHLCFRNQGVAGGRGARARRQ